MAGHNRPDPDSASHARPHVLSIHLNLIGNTSGVTIPNRHPNACRQNFFGGRS